MKSKIVVQQLTVVKNIANTENDFHNLFVIKAKQPDVSQFETNTKADMKDT